MKITVKTLICVHFQIEVKPEDSVAAVKTEIEKKLGSGGRVYPAAQQILIHQNKILINAETMHQNNVCEDSFFISMLKVTLDQRSEPVPSAGPSADKLQGLRAMVQADPHMFQLMLQELKKQKPKLAGIIEENQADLLSRLIREPVEEDEGKLLVTEKEGEAICRLEAAMGFSKEIVLKVFLACNKNEELAAKYLTLAQ